MIQIHSLSAKRRYYLLVICASIFILNACGPGDGNGLNQAGQPITNADLNSSNDLFSRVQSIFTTNCIRCHAGPSAPQGMSLTAGQSFDQIVGVASTEQPDLLRIEPGNPDDSYLVRKIRGTPGISGAQMPLGGPFLSEAQINTVVEWVSAGAPPMSANPQNPDAEFIAELTDFIGYRTWSSVDYTLGVTNQFLTDGIHSSADNAFARRVYANDIALNSEGDNFAVGSILVKETFTYQNDNNEQEFAEAGGLLAMVKRGGGFSPGGGDWEWFNLRADLSDINARGIDVRMGTCLSCHSAAELDEEGNLIGGKDFVFAHSSEAVATDETFSGYRDWDVIDVLDSRPDLLGERAHGVAQANSTRTVYKKQLYANPDSEAQGYPIGTVLVKEARDQNGDTIDVTAMVKRGAGFSPLFGDWEWFLLEPGSGQIAVDESGAQRRGAQLNNGGCVGCHSDANVMDGTGIDFVFRHEDDPFNNNSEFVAAIEDFAGYQNWQLVDYTIGAANPAIGGGHQGMSTNYTRKVYANNEALNLEGTRYDRGSIFVKEVTTRENAELTEEFSPQLGLLAMAKRGGNFNLQNNGWEYFIIENDASAIVNQAGDLNNNGCNNCHRAADGSSSLSGVDYIFPLPTIYTPTNADFENYQDWALVDERNDRNPALGEAAHNAATPNSLRKVYKKQEFAYPLGNTPGYPVGTTYVKEIFEADGTTLNGIVAMVKITETSEVDGALSSGWEWFILDPATGDIVIDEQGNERRGVGLNNNGCVGCHAAANDADGVDFVFDHPNDPFVNSASF